MVIEEMLENPVKLKEKSGMVGGRKTKKGSLGLQTINVLSLLQSERVDLSVYDGGVCS